MQCSKLELEVTQIISDYPEADTLDFPIFFANHGGQKWAAKAMRGGMVAKAGGPGQAGQRAIQAVAAIARGRVSVKFTQFSSGNSKEVADWISEPNVNELIDILNQALKNC